MKLTQITTEAWTADETRPPEPWRWQAVCAMTIAAMWMAQSALIALSGALSSLLRATIWAPQRSCHRRPRLCRMAPSTCGTSRAQIVLSSTMASATLTKPAMLAPMT